jgi:adenylate cyclase
MDTPDQPRLPISLIGVIRGVWDLFRWPRAGDLPRHVVQQIEARQATTEVLISAVQLALIVLFASLYFFGRKTIPAAATIQPVPWALAAYGTFTLARLWLACRDRVTAQVRIISILLDITVLMVTIWSFHLQYSEPAAFYLKAPTLLYVFIFLALRALSFSPLYVLITGLVAAAGWLALLAFSIHEPGGMDLITHDYVAYMTSSRILLGAEVDKVTSILVVTGLLAIAVAGSQSLLQQAVAEHDAATQLSRFMAPEIASAIIASGEMLRPGEGRQAQAATMFIDLRGFTDLAAGVSSSELVRLLSDYQRTMVPVIHRNHGIVITYLGDGIMVTFGGLQSSDAYVADALRAAEQLLDAFAEWHGKRSRKGLPAPGIGIGVTHGTVTCGAIGDESRLEFAVIGDPVNRAAKLQNYTKEEAVRALTTVDSLELAIAQGYVAQRRSERRLARSVAGIPTPVDLVAIV